MDPLSRQELRQLQRLAQRITSERPELLNGNATVGELAWVWGRDFGALGPFWRHRLWRGADGELAAWGWARLPFRLELASGEVHETKSANLTWQTHLDSRELFGEVLDWYDEVAAGVDRFLTVQDTDPVAQEIAAAHGYVSDAEQAADDGYWVQFNMRELDEAVPEPALAAGFSFLTAADVTSAAALKAHVDAWQKTRLDLSAFERIQSTWPYRRDMHVLVAAPDGTIAATAVMWFDEETRSAEFEPVGTHIDYRRLGLGSALQLHGMALARAAGARRMFVPCLGAPAHHAARDMYYGVGFKRISKDLPLVKRA